MVDGRVFIIYSASGSLTDDYCLGRLTLSGTNVLSASSWMKVTSPVFAKTSFVFGPGHASFVQSTHQTQDWMVFHSAKHSGAGWDRQGSAQSFFWNTDGTPRLGSPLAPGIPLSEPSRNPFGIIYEAETALISVKHPRYAECGHPIRPATFSPGSLGESAPIGTTQFPHQGVAGSGIDW